MSRVIVAGADQVEADVSAIYAEIRTSSITPTSFKSRAYDRTIDDPTYTETYTYVTNTVLRFGINVAKAKLTADEIRSLAPVDHTAISGGGAASSSAPSLQKSGGKKSGGNESVYSTADVIKVKHHTSEIEAFNKAITSMFASATRVIVVDIFAREKGVIKQPLEIHSVVLFKNKHADDGKHDIVVIDPSNFTYSSHLSNEDLLAAGKPPTLGKIITWYKQLQIYKAEGSVGYDRFLYRDCVDIAVKIAFGLNITPDHEINIRTISEHPVIIALSNTGIDEKFKGQGLPVRVKQSSDVAVVNSFKRIEDSTDRKLHILDTIAEHATTRKKIHETILDEAKGIDAGTMHPTLQAIQASKIPNTRRYEDIVRNLDESEAKYKVILGNAFDDRCIQELLAFDTELSGLIPAVYNDLEI